MKQGLALSLCMIFVLGAGGCTKTSEQVAELASYPIDSMDELITQSGVEIDGDVSSDGNGSLRIEAAGAGTTTVRLLETGDIDVEDARLIYRARLKAENLDGRAYLEMWCRFPGRGEAFSRGLDRPVSGTVGWTTEEIPFFCRAGENPDNVKLNLVIEGKGTVWIDDIRLLKGPLE